MTFSVGTIDIWFQYRQALEIIVKISKKVYNLYIILSRNGNFYIYSNNTYLFNLAVYIIKRIGSYAETNKKKLILYRTIFRVSINWHQKYKKMYVIFILFRIQSCGGRRLLLNFKIYFLWDLLLHHKFTSCKQHGICLKLLLWCFLYWIGSKIPMEFALEN